MSEGFQLYIRVSIAKRFVHKLIPIDYAKFQYFFVFLLITHFFFFFFTKYYLLIFLPNQSNRVGFNRQNVPRTTLKRTCLSNVLKIKKN